MKPELLFQLFIWSQIIFYSAGAAWFIEQLAAKWTQLKDRGK